MKRLYCAKDPLMIGHLRNVMALHGIGCMTRKLDLATAAGELPPIECWPELWITDDERFAEAKAVLKKTLAPVGAVRKPWRCDGCGEEIEGQFSECWKCGCERGHRSPPINAAASVSSSERQR